MQNNRTTLIAGLVAFIVGAVFGLVVLGWGVFPVEYKDGNPPGMAQRYKDQWVQMVVDSYAIDQNRDLARQRLLGFDKELPATFARLKSAAQTDRQDARAARIQKLADDLNVKVDATAAPGATPAPAVATEGGLNLFSIVLAVCGIALIAAGGIGIAFFLISRRRQQPPSAEPVPLRPSDRAIPTQPMTVTRETPSAAPTRAPAMPTGMQVEMGEPLLGRFVTTYKLGDDGYDTSFSIETPTGDFLGECGVGISDTVGEGPQKVTAFEVWLFDKNDIKTVTKVLMSEHAYNSDTIRKKLQARGDAVLANKGQEVVLETESLRIRAAVTDMAYGTGGAPQSFFGKLSMEITPTIKAKVPA